MTVGGIQLRNLVTQPVTDYKHLLGKDGYITNHESNLYHKTATQNGKEFLKRLATPSSQIDLQLSNKRQEEVQENRKKLASLIKCVIFLAKQNIPFRGHRDDGELQTESTEFLNEGNFREIVRFRVEAGDKILEKHIEDAPANAKYTSKTIQNDLINCCAAEIIEVIIGRVRQANWYSVIFDETTDSGHQAQMTFALRYVYCGQVYEDFVEFLNPRQQKLGDESACIGDSALTGRILGKIAIQFLEKHGLNKENCVGIATDGCSTMVSEERGAVAEVLKECKHAVKCLCQNHSLNLSISKSSTVIHVTRCVGVIKSVISFFTASSKRNYVLKEEVGRQLIGLCETRWIERHESVLQFCSLLTKINSALIRISEWNEAESASKAHTLHLALKESSFIVTIICLSEILSLTLPLSRRLQIKGLDVHKASKYVTDTLSTLEKKRECSEEFFKKMFKEAQELAISLDSVIIIPRTTKRQTARENYETDDAEKYYRLAILNPILDNIILDVKQRFPAESLSIYNFSVLLPEIIVEEKLDRSSEIERLSTEYAFALDMDSQSTQRLLRSEYELWSQHWIRERDSGNTLPTRTVDVLKNCDKDVYPCINTLLHILCSLPVSVAEAERSFSTLRLVKDWQRTTMREDRLTSLALMAIHRGITLKLNIERVIDRFAKQNKRKINFSL